MLWALMSCDSVLIWISPAPAVCEYVEVFLHVGVCVVSSCLPVTLIDKEWMAVIRIGV